MSETPRGPLTILREIQQKQLSAKLLSTADRRQCIEHLVGEGYSMPEVAEILQVSVRTAQRDLTRIREDHAITASPEVTRQAIGQLVLQAQQSIARLRRLARDKSVPPPTQVEAELGAWRVMKELTELLQRLGILPQAVAEVRADIHHVVQDVPGVERMQRELAIIERALGAGVGTQGVIEGVAVLKGYLQQVASTAAPEAPRGEEEGRGGE